MVTPQAQIEDQGLVATLAAYLPQDRVRAPGLLLPETVFGAALFADISGFTPLADMLARNLGAARGTDALTNIVDGLYEILIGEIEGFGGSVVGFAGDAVTCWFDGDDGRRSTAAALAMQQRMANQAALDALARPHLGASDRPKLALKVAICVGPAKRWLAGDPALGQVDVLAGRTLDELARTEHEAVAGDVLVSCQGAEALLGCIEAGEARNGVVPVKALRVLVERQPFGPLPIMRPEVLRPFVPSLVYARLRAGLGEFLAELRHAVALFMRFDGLEFDDDPDAGRKVDAFVRWVGQSLRALDGTLVQFTVGDKGSYLYAAFGAPHAHDDAAARALDAALSLRRLPPELFFLRPGQLGVSAGLMRTGAYGSRGRRTYGVLGNETNMAARLMTAALPGQVLVADHVAAPLHEDFDLRSLVPIKVKGRNEPVPLCRLFGRRRRAARARRIETKSEKLLLGRRKEIRELEGALEHALKGQPTCLSLVGPAGIGKSHLIAHLMRVAEAREVRCALVNCEARTQEAPLRPWSRLLRQLLELGQDEGLAARGHRLGARLIERLAARAPELVGRATEVAQLLDISLGAGERAEPAPMSVLVHTAGALLTALARAEPILAVIENAQWMDPGSTAMLQAVSRVAGPARLLLAIAIRPDAQGLVGRIVEVGPLSKTEAAELVGGRLSMRPDALALEILYAKTEGNPLFLEALAGALSECGGLVIRAGKRAGLSDPILERLRSRGVLVRREATWHLADVPIAKLDLGLAHSLEGVLLARLDGLAEPARLLLKALSVLGRHASIALLKEVLEGLVESHGVETQLVALVEQDFVSVEGGVAAFRHDLLQDVAYHTLPMPQRVELHRRALRALEQRSADDVATLAAHAEAAQAPADALRYLEAGARQALRLATYPEGLEYVRRAFGALAAMGSEASPGAAGRLDLAHAELLIGASKLDQARSLLEAIISRSNDADLWPAAWRWLCRIHELAGRLDEAVAAGARALEVAGPRDRSLATAVRLSLGLTHLRRGDLRAAGELARQGLADARESQDSLAEARAYALAGAIYRRRNRVASALEALERSLDLYRRAENPLGEGQAHNLLGAVCQDAGRFQEAIAHFAAAHERFASCGSVLQSILCANNLASLLRDLERWEESARQFGEALEVIESNEVPSWVRAGVCTNRALLHVRRRKPSLAKVDLAAARAVLAPEGSADLWCLLERTAAEAALLDGALEAGLSAADRALEHAARLGSASERALTLQVRARLRLRGGDLAAAAEDARASVETLAGLGRVADVARSRIVWGETLVALGQPVEATKLWREALSEGQASGAREEDRAWAQALLERHGL